jgi:hypothetical protein
MTQTAFSKSVRYLKAWFLKASADKTGWARTRAAGADAVQPSAFLVVIND